MNYITKKKYFLLLFVSFAYFASCKTTNSTISAGNVKNVKSVRIEIEQGSNALVPIEGIPIMAYFGVQIHTVERYRELKEAGIDINFSYLWDIEKLAQAMEAAKEAGVRMLIHPETIEHFKDHPALAGYWLTDEPHRIDFSHFGELAREVQAIDNEHFCYVNLTPNYATPEQLGTSTYREYVQLFVNEIPVQFLSFDHYPIYLTSSGVRAIREEWYDNLEIISYEAKKVGKPFWAFAATSSFWSNPIPTLADLRLQVFSNLAYGAQGIQYFTYWTPPPSYPEGFHDGPIDDHTGQKTPTWYTVQQISREIKALSNVFLDAQVIKVEHIATNALGTDEDIPIGTVRFDFTNRPAEASIIKSFKTIGETNALVSFLKKGKKYYMVVINRNLEGSDNMTFSIKGGAGLKIINKDGKAVPAILKGSKQTITPGDVLIYGWDIK